VVLEKTLESPSDARRSNQSILKEISPEYSLEGLMLKLKLQYFGHLMRRTDLFEKTLMLGKIEGWRRRGLDKTLADYFPELVGRIENAEKITLRLMVQHRSGIPNYTDHPGFWENPPESSKETLELALDLPASFEPDEDYGYSNINNHSIKSMTNCFIYLFLNRIW